MTKHRYVRIDWLDACMDSGTFTTRGAESLDIVSVSSVGHLVKYHRDRVIVAQEWQSERDYRHTTAIPRRCIVRITYLEPAGDIKKASGG